MTVDVAGPKDGTGELQVDRQPQGEGLRDIGGAALGPAAHDRQVAVFIDFENLVFTTGRSCELDCKKLMQFSTLQGRVVLACAYADWRSPSYSRYQKCMHELGIELVHVLAKRAKNSVDIKIAVDAIRSAFSLPHISTYVIVSGDRDFIHIVRELRRQGKTVVGVSPSKGKSEDFATTCDWFIDYEKIAGGPEEDDSGTPTLRSIDEVKAALNHILQQRPNGVFGAQIKPFLRRKISEDFSEKQYGFRRMRALLESMPDIATIVPQTSRDVLVLPASQAPAQPACLPVHPSGSAQDAVESEDTDRSPSGDHLAGIPAKDIAEIRILLHKILLQHPDGVPSARIKTLLCEAISGEFNANDYGFSSFRMFLDSVSDIARVVERYGRDILVVPVVESGLEESSEESDNEEHQQLNKKTTDLILRACLRNYKYEPNASARREFLATIFEIITDNQPLNRAEILSFIQNRIDPSGNGKEISSTWLARYLTIFFQTGSVNFLPNQPDLSMKDRKMELNPKDISLDQFCRGYETSIVYKVVRSSSDTEIDAELVSRILGLGEGDLNYSAELLQVARSRLNHPTEEPSASQNGNVGHVSDRIFPAKLENTSVAIDGPESNGHRFETGNASNSNRRNQQSNTNRIATAGVWIAIGLASSYIFSQLVDRMMKAAR